MTELARTPPDLRRLFDIVDMAPQPRAAALADSLHAWNERRNAGLAPKAADMAHDETASVRDHSFVAESLADGHDLAFSAIGAAARSLLGLAAGAARLSDMTNERLAVRLRHLSEMVLERGEPILVRFVGSSDGEARANFEMLAAPVMLSTTKAGLFCAIALEPVPVPDR